MWFYKKGVNKIEGSPFSPIINEILTKRGVEPSEFERFVFNTEAYKHDPLEMKGVKELVERLIQAKNNGETVLNYTDSDCDGVCSGALFFESMTKAGIKVDTLVGDRAVYGYGLSVKSVDDILLKFPDVKLVITTDNGVSSSEAIEYAKSKNLEIYVTDHHQIDSLPDAVVVNPHQDGCNYPYKPLCGTGVIYKVVEALYDALGMDSPEEFLDLVAVGTVGDVVELKDENRYFVKKGLELINAKPRPIFREIVKTDKFNSDSIAYYIVPTLNSTGRLATAKISFDAILGDAASVSKAIELNEERKKLSLEGFEMASVSQETGNNIIIIDDESIHPGVAGIVAGRLKEHFEVPSAVLVPDGKSGEYKGSMRSYSWLNCFEFLKAMSPHLTKWGGHELAGGFSLKTENIEEFRKASKEYVSKIIAEKGENLSRKYIDSMVSPSALSLDLVMDIEKLEPFGAGFESPIFGLKPSPIQSVMFMGEKKNHVKIKCGIDILQFNCDTTVGYEIGKSVKAIGKPSINEYKGSLSLQFLAQDIIKVD